MRHVRQYHHHSHLGWSYLISRRRHIALFVFVPTLILFVAATSLFFFGVVPQHEILEHLNYVALMVALGATIVRLLVAYLISIIIAVPLALLVTYNTATEKVFLPIFDVLESVPVLVFFPIIIIVFTRFGFFNGAAVFIIFINMLWNIVFNLIAGLKLIPEDITSAAKVFRFSRIATFLRVTLPALIPSLVTGSILAWGNGWNMIIVAEVVHTYVPQSVPAHDLFGIGSVLVNASASGNSQLFIGALLVLISAITLINFFVWQRLLHYAERFKFE